MRLEQLYRKRRPGFSLVELLVVIAIIGILASLTAAAVMAVRGRGRDVTARNEIAQISAALESFKQKFGCYPPDNIVLDPSNAYLRRIFPRATSFAPYTGQTIAGPVALYFWLMGPEGNGFSTNPLAPFTPGGDRIKPFLEGFPNSRIGGSIPQRMLLDPYKNRPYLYFASRYGNDYPFSLNVAPFSGQSLTVAPFKDATTSPPRYINAHSFQIVCAGPDGLYGPGDLWQPGAGPYAVGNQPGADDLANFHPLKLSAPNK
jgi:prepilin-type N-terminal cleavage/methylation domain-containing protein